MGYEIFNRSWRCVGHFTSNLGYYEIGRDVARRKKRFPEFHAFLASGCGDITPRLLQEIRDYIALDRKCVRIAEDLLEVIKRMKFARLDI